MNTIRTITMVSTILAGALLGSLAPAAAQTYDPDCSQMTTPVSSLVWDMDSETYVASAVDIGREDVVPTAFRDPAVALSAPGCDPNVALDESLIGAGGLSTAKTLSFDPGS
jgi:hypothetical protein